MPDEKKPKGRPLNLEYPWYPKDLVINPEGQKRKDSYDISLCLLEVFYRNGTINTETYIAVKKHFKEESLSDNNSNCADDGLSQKELINEESLSAKAGRKPKELDDLEQCFGLVEQGAMTVQAACNKLGIGRSTYYRRYRAYNKGKSDTD